MKLFWAFMALYCGSLSQPGFAVNICTGIPSQSSDPPVMVCEDETAYHFSIAGTKSKYNKKEFQTAFSARLLRWAAAKGLPESVFAHSQVAFWLSVPESNPPGTMARAIVDTQYGELIIYMAIHPTEWQWDEDDMGVFKPGDLYPESYGMRFGQLLLKKQSEASLADLSDWLQSHGSSLGENFSGDWYALQVPYFNEVETQINMEADSRFPQMLEKLQANFIYEWIAWRAAVFHFKMGPYE